MTCEGLPRSGGKTVSLLAYTSLDVGKKKTKTHKPNKHFFSEKNQLKITQLDT